jgi:hypothetical protein
MEISVNNLLKPALVAFVLAAMGAASPAMAEEWKRPTVHGGELTREVTRDGRVYTGETTRTGPNGGTYSSNSTCFDGFVDRCKRSFAATGPEGKTVSGKSYLARGPHGGRQVGLFQGANGNRYVGVRRVWRR